MPSTLLQLAQEHCRRQGLTVPSILASSRDDQYIQLIGLFNEVLDDLLPRQQWTALQREAVWTSVASESQGTLSSLAPAGFQWILNDTIYDRTRRLPIFGPRGAQYWQLQKAVPFTGPYYQFRIVGDELKVLPVMTAGHTCAFEYASSYPVVDADVVLPTPYKQWFTKDSDTCLLPDRLMILGIRWVWKKEKGFQYAEDFRKYEAAVADFAGHDGGKPVLNMNGPDQAIVRPGFYVPAGNWMQS